MSVFYFSSFFPCETLPNTEVFSIYAVWNSKTHGAEWIRIIDWVVVQIVYSYQWSRKRTWWLYERNLTEDIHLLKIRQKQLNNLFFASVMSPHNTIPCFCHYNDRYPARRWVKFGFDHHLCYDSTRITEKSYLPICFFAKSAIACLIRTVNKRNLLAAAGDFNVETVSAYINYPDNTGKCGKWKEMKVPCIYLIFVWITTLSWLTLYFRHPMAHRSMWTNCTKFQDFKHADGTQRKNWYRNQNDYIIIRQEETQWVQDARPFYTGSKIGNKIVIMKTESHLLKKQFKHRTSQMYLNKLIDQTIRNQWICKENPWPSRKLRTTRRYTTKMESYCTT